MHKIFKQIIQWYCLRFPFPRKGEKYFLSMVSKLDLFKEKFIKKLRSGVLVEVSASDHIERHLLWYGYYEKNETETMKSLFSRESVFIDIGANIGYYSLLAAKIITNGRIFSFEPVTTTFLKFQKNVQLNQFDSIRCIQSAISDFNGTTNVFVSEDDNSGMSGLQSAENFSGTTEIIQCYTLDEAQKAYQIPKIDFIKMDVEGSELSVLKGMEAILTSQQPVLFIEVSVATLSMYNERIESIFELLFLKEYQAYKVTGINKLEQVLVPQEADLMFFFKKSFQFPSAITVINL